MTPMQHSQKSAGRTGHWRAGHWKLAFLGWLAFVGLAVVLGGVVGTKEPEASVVSDRTATVVVRAADVTSPAIQRGIDELKREALFDTQFGSAMKVSVDSGKTVATVAIPLQSGSNAAAAERAVNTLLGEIVPMTIGTVADTTVTVNGQTVGTSDFERTLTSRAPLIVFASLLALAFPLLLITRPRTRPVVA